ncbi:MAG: septal ring lytic transglycosylase RlpA family protein [Longimicrobiales bacterium]
MPQCLPTEMNRAFPLAAGGLPPIGGFPAAGWILLLFLLQGCSLVGGSSAPGPSPSPGPSAAEAPPPGRLVGWTQTGVASWYGNPFHGRQTASGEVYDMDRLTAAHQTLPFGTRVRVENLDNGKSVILRVNDRGPFARGRILDVSRRAARELEMVGPGTARVRITVLEEPG